MGIFDKKTITILASALAVTIICLTEPLSTKAPFSLIVSGMGIANTMFHEIGHSLFSWFFGIPTVPAVFTVIGGDQAGGVAYNLAERTMTLQIIMYFVMAYGCYWVWNYAHSFFIIVAALFMLIVIMSFTKYYEVVILFMGHGGAMLTGAFFLFRAILHLGPKPVYERWLNAFFGLFLIVQNMHFGYKLIYDYAFRMKYTSHKAFGAIHNDLEAITHIVYSWNVNGVAWFLIAFGAFLVIATFLLAIYLKDSFYRHNVEPFDVYTDERFK
jgi:hypothetical protein